MRWFDTGKVMCLSRPVVEFPPVGQQNRLSPQPLHVEVAALIQAEIERGMLRPGGLLPSERVMSERLIVSRATLRKALTTLAERGLLSPSHGRGWFVTESLLGELPNSLQSFTELAAARGLRASSRIELSHVREASLDESEELEIAPGASLYELRRLRLIEKLPVAIDHARLPLEVCPSLVGVDLETQSLYRTLERHGVQPSRCDYAVQAVAAEQTVAERLNIAVGSPLLLATGMTSDQNGRPIELSHVLYIGDRYRFRATLYRRQDARRTSNPGGARE